MSYPGPAHFEFIDRRKYIDVSAHKRSFLSSKKSQTRWPDTAGHLQTFCFFHRKKISQNSDLTSIQNLKSKTNHPQKISEQPWHVMTCDDMWWQDEGEPPDLLELLLKHAEKVAPSCREPRLLSLDLRPTVPVSQRGLLPCHSVPFLNALVQTLLASSLMPLLAQVWWICVFFGRSLCPTF